MSRKHSLHSTVFSSATGTSTDTVQPVTDLTDDTCYLRVVEVLKDLPHGDSSNEEEEDEPTETEGVGRRDPQHELQVERVQLRKQELQNMHQCTSVEPNSTLYFKQHNFLHSAVTAVLCPVVYTLLPGTPGDHLTKIKSS